MANNLTLSTIDPISGSPAPSYDTTTAKFGQALAVGTASSAVGVPVAGFTAECWSKGFPSAGTGQPRIMLGSSTIFWIGAQAGLTNIVGSLGAGGTAVTLTGPTLASLGSTWHHFALTCGPGGCTLWVDGVSAATTSTPIASTGATSGAGLGLRNFETGPNYYGPFTWNNNEIDEVALFSGIRYTAAFTPPAAPYAGSETNLLALFHLDGNGTDSSGVAPANAVGAPVVSGTTAGGTSTISGTTTGAAPTGLTYSLDSGAAVTVTVPTLGSGTYSFTITTPAAGAHTISVTGTGPNTTTGGPTSFTSTSSAVVPSIYPDDPAMLYSPSNWQVLHGAATAWNPGAYFRTLFSGTSCTLNFDVSNNATPFSQIWYRVDNGPWTAAPVAATIVCAIPALTAGNADLPFHLIEVWFKSMDSTGVLNRWTAPAQTAIRFLGLTLAAGGAVMAPGSAPIKVVVFGDSIVEGIRTLGEAVSTTPDDNDALFGWVAALREHLGAEIGFVGWGGTGYGGTFANVPVFGTSLASLAAGVARSFTPSPDLIIINHGTNDAGANIQAAATAAVNALLAATTCPIVLLNPLPTNRQSNAYLAAVPAASNIPARVHYVSSAGFMVNAAGVDTTLFHPSGPNGAALIAPKVAAAVMPFLASPGGVLNRWTHNAFTATGAAPSLGAVTVTGLVQGGGTTITGTYANGTPTGLTYSILGGAPVTVSSPTIGGGTYSFSIATPTAGTYSITVTGTGGNTATSSFIGFTTTASAGAYPLDGQPAPWAAVTTQRMLSSWTGNLVRVRRDSDNAEQDFGFITGGANDGYLNGAAISAFVGTGAANNGYVTRWYDQSGNSRDFVQATAIAQPIIVLAGAVNGSVTKPKLSFSSTGGVYHSLAAVTGVSGTLGLMATCASQSAGYQPVRMMLATQIADDASPGFQFVRSNAYATLSNNPIVTQAGAVTGIRGWLDGVLQTSVNPFNTAGGPLGGNNVVAASMTAGVGGNVTIGNLPGKSDQIHAMQGAISDIVIWQSTIPSDAQFTSISQSLLARA